MDANEELYRETIIFLNEIKDIRLKCLYLHLIVEGYINQIVKKVFKHPNKILDSRFYSFHKKIEILKEMGAIGGTTFHNLKTINNIRNDMAHNLYFAHSVIEKEFLKIKFPKGTKLPSPNQENKISYLVELTFKDIYEKLKPFFVENI
jgi:hypothetical protein